MPPVQAPASKHVAAELDIDMPAAAEGLTPAEGVQGQQQQQQQQAASHLQEQQLQREAHFMDAGTGETEAWAAANGGIWAVHTLRDLIMCALSTIECLCLLFYFAPRSLLSPM
jgi:hypothetical protein